jgi:hypothetical protein
MATNYKVLGQSAPAATTETTLYTVPALTMTVVSTLVVANRSASDATFRITIAPNGAATANSQYIAYDLSCGGNGLNAFTFGLTMDAADVVRVYASSADLSFSIFGSEIS